MGELEYILSISTGPSWTPWIGKGGSVRIRFPTQGGAGFVILPAGGVHKAPAVLCPELPANPMEFMTAEPLRWEATYEGVEGPATVQISRLIVG